MSTSTVTNSGSPALFSTERVKQNFNQMSTTNKVATIAASTILTAGAAALTVLTVLGSLALTYGVAGAAASLVAAIVVLASQLLKTPKATVVAPQQTAGQKAQKALQDAGNFLARNSGKIVAAGLTAAAIGYVGVKLHRGHTFASQVEGMQGIAKAKRTLNLVGQSIQDDFSDAKAGVQAAGSAVIASAKVHAETVSNKAQAAKTKAKAVVTAGCSQVKAAGNAAIDYAKSIEFKTMPARAMSSLKANLGLNPKGVDSQIRYTDDPLHFFSDSI